MGGTVKIFHIMFLLKYFYANKNYETFCQNQTLCYHHHWTRRVGEVHQLVGKLDLSGRSTQEDLSSPGTLHGHGSTMDNCSNQLKPSLLYLSIFSPILVAISWFLHLTLPWPLSAPCMAVQQHGPTIPCLL